MVWSNLDFNIGDVLTASKMNQLYDNFSAVAMGEYGAPKIKPRGINIGSSINHFSDTNNRFFLFNTYYFLPRVKFNSFADLSFGGYGINRTQAHITIHLTYAPGISINNPAAVSFKYLRSSPPYDLGYGEIPMFIFLRLNSQGEIISATTTQDPPWANSLDTEKTILRNGSVYYRRLKNNQPKITDANTPDQMRACLHVLSDDNCWEEVELTQAIKNENMNALPHPFFNVQSDEKVLLLDVLSSTGQELVSLIEQGDVDAVHVLSTRYLRLDNEPLDVNSPRGVLTVRAHWKDNSSGNNP